MLPAIATIEMQYFTHLLYCDEEISVCSHVLDDGMPAVRSKFVVLQANAT